MKFLNIFFLFPGNSKVRHKTYVKIKINSRQRQYQFVSIHQNQSKFTQSQVRFSFTIIHDMRKDSFYQKRTVLKVICCRIGKYTGFWRRVRAFVTTLYHALHFFFNMLAHSFQLLDYRYTTMRCINVYRCRYSSNKTHRHEDCLDVL